MPRRLELVETRPTGHGRARGLVSSRSSGRRIEAHAYAAPPELTGVVAGLWSGRWDLRGQPDHETQLLSDPCLHFVLEAGEQHAGSRIVGVWTRLWRRVLSGRGRVLGVKLRPGAVRAFLDVPAFRFTNRIVPLASVFQDALALERAALEPEDDAEAFAVITAWLVAHKRVVDRQMHRIVALADRIASDPEIATVERLAAHAGLGPRALQRLFREHLGASPKWVIRRNRLQEVALRIERGDEVNLAALAAALGYTDQAYLARDFKTATGKTPTEFARHVADDRSRG